MIEQIDMYKTNDGKTFDSVSNAEEHILNGAAEVIANRLSLSKLNITSSERFKIVDALTKDIDTLTSLYNELNYWLAE